MQKYAFIDRDGTIIVEPQDTFQVDSLDKLQILDGAIEGLQLLVADGFKLIMISNQNGIGTASFPQKDFDIPQQAMLDIFSKEGIEFSQVFVCPHFATDNCSCRKPKTGLVDDFLRKEKIDKTASVVVGDRETDGQFAKNIGVGFTRVETNGNSFRGTIKNWLNEGRQK